jgi:alpha-glucosidase (family GH31 glycosyl hydrolase)
MIMAPEKYEDFIVDKKKPFQEFSVDYNDFNDLDELIKKVLDSGQKLIGKF